MLSLWVSVFDHLFLENASKEVLFYLFVVYSLGLVVMFVVIISHVRRLGRREARP